MSSIKDFLKKAKAELARGDYEEVIDISKKVLKEDSENYFAYVFLGKAYSSIEDKLKESADSYIKATVILPTNLLAWKGLFQLIKQKKVLPKYISFDSYFYLCGEYSDILLEQELPLVELIHEIRVIRKEFPECEESFLTHMKPGLPMSEKLGRHLMSPQNALKDLIKVLDEKEQQSVSKIVSRERLKLSASDPEYQIKINALAWEVYQYSEVDKLFNQLVNITDDDETRADLESQWLEYRIKVLKSMPTDIKGSFFHRVKSMVEDMVLVDHKSLRAWKLYFEWQDYTDLDSFDSKVVLKFFKRFPSEPIALILYAWVCCKFSTYDVKEWSLEKEYGKEEIIEENGNITENEALELKEMVENDEVIPSLLESDILTSLMENIEKAKSSSLAYRIISQYYILSREYEAASPYLKAGISLITYSVRDLGATLNNCKLALTLDLATVYTYLDAPKNHRAALALFEKILEEDKENSKAKLGKSLIFMEREQWSEAKELLIEVTKRYSDNMEILSELGWSEAKLGNFDDALNIFKDVLQKIQGVDIRASNLRAMTLWRQATAYLYKQVEEDGDITDSDLRYVNISYNLLIQALKALDTFSPAYCALGDIYSKYYRDKNRAFRCYYKAFELNSGDIIAAKYMVENYTDSGNWAAAKLVAEAIINSNDSKKYLKETCWPYRVVGIANLEKQRESDAIEWFQSGLRIENDDVESWVGLGQAYFACGRIEASIKVFQRATELDPDHLYAKYFTAISFSEIGQYLDSVDLLKEITEISSTEESFHASYADILVKYALDLFDQGYLTKSVSIAIDAIMVIQYIIVDLKKHPHNVWLSLSKALRLFIMVESRVDELPIEIIVSIFQAFTLNGTDDVDVLDCVNLENLLSTSDNDNISITCQFLIIASKYAIATGNLSEASGTVKSSLWHNVGIAELVSYLTVKLDKYRDAAIVCFKKSIRYQSNCAEVWIGLGIATMELNWRISQHCFVKATALAPRDTEIWFNLSLLALKNNDTEFTRKLLSRSQGIAPQDSSLWFAMALMLETEGKTLESSNMFAHSFVLSNGKSKASQLLYAKSVLQNQVARGKDERNISNSEELTAVAYGLEQYFKKSPNDAFALQCSLLVLERLHLYSNAQEISDRLSSILENRFDKTQDETELYNFAIIKAQFARIQLGLGEYQKAIENAELSEGILSEYDEEKSLKTQISNNVCLGLAHFFMDNIDGTFDHFQTLLKLSKDSKHLILLISNVLYDVGTEETKSIAFDELTEFIVSYGNELLVTLSIAAMSIIDNNTELLNTILEELVEIPLGSRIRDIHQDIPYLITQINNRLNITNDEMSDRAIWQKTAMFFPNNNQSWSKLSTTISQRLTSENQNKVTASQLGEQYCNLKNLRNVQRAMFLCPWDRKSVRTLKECF